MNGWVLVYELSGCMFESSCSHLNFRLCACFKQRVLWHSGNYRVWIHSETRTWHDKNMESLVSLLMLKCKRNGTWIMKTHCFFLLKNFNLTKNSAENAKQILLDSKRLANTHILSIFNKVKSIILTFRVKNWFYSFL